MNWRKVLFNRRANSERELLTLCQSVVSNLLPIRYPTIEMTARVLGISVRTLQRRLLWQGMSYSQLVRDVRFNKACNQLEKPAIKISEVAIILGYKDMGSFSRAFRSWTKLSPIAYRRYRINSKDGTIDKERYKLARKGKKKMSHT